MEDNTRISVVGIIIEDRSSAEQVSVVLDAPMDVISALSGKLGRLKGVSSKALYSKAEGGKG